MAKGSSRFRPKFPPAGMNYGEAKAAENLRESPTWWLQYYIDGRNVRESTHREEGRGTPTGDPDRRCREG